MSDIYREWNNLTTAEKIFLATHPIDALFIRRSKSTAFAETSKRFGYNGHNDQTDAFRHCFWSALLARDIGYLDAYLFTTAHETDPANPPAEKAMDLHNNSVGLKIGQFWIFPDSNADLSNQCFEALQQGKLKTSP